MKQLLTLFGLFFTGQVIAIAMDNPLEALGVLIIGGLIVYAFRNLIKLNL